MLSSLFLYGPVMLLLQAGLLLALAWVIAQALRWQDWGRRVLMLALLWAGCSLGGFLVFGAAGADVFIIPYGLAVTAIPAALLALVLWWLAERLVRKID